MVKFEFIYEVTNNSKPGLSISFVEDECDALETFLEETLDREREYLDDDSDRVVYSFSAKEPILILNLLDYIKENFSEIYTAANVDDYLDKNYRILKQQQEQLLKDRKLSDLRYTLSNSKLSDSEKVGSFKQNLVRKGKITEEEAKTINLSTKDVFHKSQLNLPDSRLAEYQAVAAALFKLFLGEDRAPTTRVVYDSIGIRQGTISAALENWESLKCYFQTNISGFPKTSQNQNFNNAQYYPQDVANKLVEDGIIDVFVVAYFLGDVDRHFENIGYSNGKICVIDFDRTFWPLVQGLAKDKGKSSFFDLENIKSLAKKRLPLDDMYIGENFVNLYGNTDDSFPWFDRNLFSHGNKANPKYDRSDALAYNIKLAPSYQEKLFFSLLNIIVTPIESINVCIEPIIKNKKHKDALYAYVSERRNIFTYKCLQEEEFRIWLIANEIRLKTTFVNQNSILDQLLERAKNFCEENGNDSEDSQNLSFDSIYLDPQSSSISSEAEEWGSKEEIYVSIDDARSQKSDIHTRSEESDDVDDDDDDDTNYSKNHATYSNFWRNTPEQKKKEPTSFYLPTEKLTK